MKICIPALSDEGLDAKVSDHFGSAPYFTLVDTDSDAMEIVANDHHHGQGRCSPIKLFKNKNLDAIICHGLGKNAFAVLAKFGLPVYTASESTVRAAVDAFKAQNVTYLTADTACGGHTGKHNCHHGKN